jgi:hypothetical protein
VTDHDHALPSESFQQDVTNRPIRDFVFPVGRIVGDRFELEGTAFFIGGGGLALTAAHVAHALADSQKVALFVKNEKWIAIDIIQTEAHPIEDVAIIKIDGSHHSFFRIDATPHHSSLEYMLWGYPENVANEVRQLEPPSANGGANIRPDLIYSGGHIRRRISRELPISLMRGVAFYELSSVAGACCSGAPVCAKSPFPDKTWKLIGIYIGESTGDRTAAVGYATRMDAVYDWVPAIAGCALGNIIPSMT